MSKAASSVLIVLLSAALVACGSGALVPTVTEAPRVGGSQEDIQPRDLALGVKLASLRGQSLVSVELAKRHRSAEALLVLEHARDYAQFLFQLLGGGNGERSFKRFNRAIDVATTGLRRGEGSGALTEALVTAGRETLRIESEIVGETTDLTAYRASVVSFLADAAASFYELAVVSDPSSPPALAPSIADPGIPLDRSAVYRAAYGLLREAANIHEGLATILEELTHDNARAADTLLAAMFEAMPSAEVPPDLTPPDEVLAAAYLLGVLLANDHGAISPSPRNRLAFIPPLLEEALGAYESGEAGVADVLLEKVRASLCCPQTSEGDALETDLERLSSAIRSGAADHDIAALVEEASALAAVAAEN